MLPSTIREEVVTEVTARPVAAAPLVASAKVSKDFGALGVEVEIGSETVLARVAFSCLVQPIAGDRVLLSQDSDSAFVLAVLERQISDRATLSLPSRGALVVEAESIGFSARDALSMDAQTVNVRSRRFNVIADGLTLFGKIIDWVGEQIRVSAKTQETIVDTMSSKAIDRISIVERADVLRAESLTQTITGVAVTAAPAAVIATTEDLRLDGKRVTVG